MREKLCAYIEKIFSAAPQTERVKKLKDETTKKSLEKYDEFIAQGMSEEEAYNKASQTVDGIADLIEGAKQPQYADNTHKSEKDSRYAINVSIAVGLYFIAVAVIILFSLIGDKFAAIGCVLMLVIAGFATSLLVYNDMTHGKHSDSSTKPEITIDDNRQLFKECDSILWIVIVIAYLLISFTYSAWAYSWIIFIIGVVLSKILKLIFEMRRK
jgi:cobalamin synthase